MEQVGLAKPCPYSNMLFLMSFTSTDFDFFPAMSRTAPVSWREVRGSMAMLLLLMSEAGLAQRCQKTAPGSLDTGLRLSRADCATAQ